MLHTLLVSIAAFTLMYILLLIQSTSLKSLEADINHLKNRQTE